MGLENVASARATSIGIGVESPSSKSRSRSHAPSRASEKPGSEHHSQVAPTVSDSRNVTREKPSI